MSSWFYAFIHLFIDIAHVNKRIRVGFIVANDILDKSQNNISGSFSRSSDLSVLKFHLKSMVSTKTHSGLRLIENTCDRLTLLENLEVWYF